MMKNEINETVKKIGASSPPPNDMITKEYADILVNQLLNTTESIVILNARSKLQFYDQKLKDLGLRATIKIGIEKIERV
jgi:hypothetical protein